MKAITITIDEGLDASAAAEARRRGISKSQLIRDGLRKILPDEELPSAPPGEENLWVSLAGFVPSDIAIEPGEIDAVVYDA